MLLNNVLNQLRKSRKQNEQSEVLKFAINREKMIGSTLFGKVPDGVKREFYCIDEESWMWRDSWKNKNGNIDKTEVIFRIQDNSLYKTVGGIPYELSHTEKRNFKRSVEIYHNKVLNEIYTTNVYSF